MKEKIFTICDTLSRTGVSPTAEKVRAELGGGSFSTISPIIKQWRDSLSKAEPAPEIPAAAQTAVNQATALIWKMATEHQAEAINAVRQECARIEHETIAERDEALKEITFLEEKLKVSEEQIKTLLTKDAARASEANALELQIHKQQLALDNTVNQNIELKSEIKDLRKLATTAQNEASKLEGMLEVFTKTKTSTSTKKTTKNTATT